MLQKHDTCDFSRVIKSQFPPLYEESVQLNREAITAIGSKA